MRKIAKITTAFLVATVLFVTGCQKQELLETKINTIDPIVLKMSSDPQIQSELMFMKNSMGYNLSKVYVGKAEASGYYGIFDGFDGLELPREFVQEQMNAKASNANTAQKHRVSSMATSGAKDIRILSGVPSAWITAVDAGRSAWNGLGKTLTFNTPVSGASASGKLNVSYVDFSTLGYPLTAIASGSTPGGSIGNNLRINSNWKPSKGAITTSLTTSQRKFVMAHELGHNIGFAHTDTYEGVALTTLNYTCSNYLDPSSVLRPGTDPVPGWTSFSTCDADAFDWYYGGLLS